MVGADAGRPRWYTAAVACACCPLRLLRLPAPAQRNDLLCLLLLRESSQYFHLHGGRPRPAIMLGHGGRRIVYNTRLALSLFQARPIGARCGNCTSGAGRRVAGNARYGRMARAASLAGPVAAAAELSQS